MSDKKLTVREERRFVLGNRMIASEVKLGRTLFIVTSRMANETSSFKDIVRKIAEREIRRSDQDAG